MHALNLHFTRVVNNLTRKYRWRHMTPQSAEPWLNPKIIVAAVRSPSNIAHVVETAAK